MRNRKRQAVYLLLLTFTLILLLLPAATGQSIHAQGDICVDIDLTTSNGDFYPDPTYPYGSWVFGQGWVSDDQHDAIIVKPLPFHLTTLTGYYTIDSGSPTGAASVQYFDSTYTTITYAAHGDVVGDNVVSMSTSSTGVSYIALSYGDTGAGGRWTRVTYCGSDVPTLTPTSEFSTPSGALAVPPKNCAMLGPANSSFLDPNDWTFLGATYYETAPNRSARLGSNTYATLEDLNLNPTDSYSWEVIYQGLGTSNGTFTVQIGALPYQINAARNTDQQVYDHPSVKIPADDSTGKYTVTISRPPGSPNDIVIRYFCITKDVGSGGPVVAGGTTSDECTVCDPPTGFTDIIGIINWLVCNIRRQFLCYLLPALAGWLAFLVLLVRYFVSFVEWLVTGVSNGVIFLAGFIISRINIARVLIENVPKYLSNSVHVSGIANVANITASGVRDLPTTITNALESFGGELSAIFTTSQNLLELILRLIWLVVQAIVFILGLIPLAMTSLIDGLMSSGGPVSGSPLCSDTSSPLYAPCLGFYVLDNTIFAGPAGYILPVLVLVFVFENITWALNRIKEELSK